MEDAHARAAGACVRSRGPPIESGASRSRTPAGGRQGSGQDAVDLFDLLDVSLVGFQSHVPFQTLSGLGVIGSRLNAQNLPFPHDLPAVHLEPW